LHHGSDLGNPLGSPVQAVGSGRVIYAGSDAALAWGPTADFYGNLVLIQHTEQLGGEPLYSLYGHLSQVNTAADARVAAGDVIGEVGATGVALGPHLHLEFRSGRPDYDATRNPELFLEPLPGHGAIVGRVLDRRMRSQPDIDVVLFSVGSDGTRTWVQQTRTYPGENVNSTLLWRENFVFSDTPVGEYAIEATIGSRRVNTRATVPDRAVVRVELRPLP